MKKKVILHVITLILISTVSNAQDIVERLKGDVCFCVDQQTKANFKIKKSSVLETCLERKIVHYSSNYLQILEEEGFIEKQLKNRVGFLINLNHLNAFITSQHEYFINECESYYLYSSALRTKFLIDIVDNDAQKKIKRLTKKINKSNSQREHYYERGIQYLALGKYEDAKKDFFYYLKDDPEHIQATYFLAWSLELNNEYTLAISWYKQLIKTNNHNESSLGLEIAKRKLKEREEFYISKSLASSTFQNNNSFSANSNKSSFKLETVPVMLGCEGIKDQSEAKRCMSEIVKRYINRHFNISYALQYANLQPGEYTIYNTFKISKDKKITDINVLFDDPFIVNEAKRVLKSLPNIVEPGKRDGKPVGVYYSLPIKFLIKY